jgi:excalibur calcium-binding domain-containing protein/PASTA domain-containing protein
MSEFGFGRALASAGKKTGPRLGRGAWIAIGGVVVVGLIVIVGSLMPSKTVPDVVGMNPQQAIAAMHDAGVSSTESHGGIGIEEDKGFVVCRTVPAAGEKWDPSGEDLRIYSSQTCEPRTALAKAGVRERRQQRRRWRRYERRADRELAAAEAAAVKAAPEPVAYDNCDAAREAGVAPIEQDGEPELYELNSDLDANADGIACEPPSGSGSGSGGGGNGPCNAVGSGSLRGLLDGPGGRDAVSADVRC